MRIALLTDTAKLPTRKHPLDAGLDLYLDAPDFLQVEIFPGEVVTLYTGVTVEIPQGYFGWITNKSKSNYLVGAGIVDEGYQGELLVKVFNPTLHNIYLNHGDAIAQLLIIPVWIPMLEVVPSTEIHEKMTVRGDSGGILEFPEEDFYDYTQDDFNFDAMRERF